MRLLALLLLACTGIPKDDTGEAADADTDADTDTDTDADTDADPKTGVISGMVLLWDGRPAAMMEVQVCSTVCRYTETDQAGNFTQGGLEGARYKVDAIGATYSEAGFGNALVGVDLGVAEAFAISPAMVAPPVSGPVVVNETSGSRTYDVGAVSLTFTASSMVEMPFGAVDSETGNFDLYAGVLEGAAVPALWSVSPAFVVSFLPWGAELGEPMDVEVTGLTSPDGTYQVYSLAEYGEVEGPLGTATVTGGTATATGLQPSAWTWLMFVPA